MSEDRKPPSRTNWPLESFDARDWAKEFMRIFDKRRGEIDESLMLGWFANALMRGFDEHANRVPPSPTLAHVEKLAAEYAEWSECVGSSRTTDEAIECRMSRERAKIAFLSALRALGDADERFSDGIIERVAGEITDTIIADLTDRGGFRQVWEGIDAKVCAEIHDAWASIVLTQLRALRRGEAG